MILVLQIALGIVLGFLILGYLRQVIVTGLWLAGVAAVVALMVLIWWAMRGHWADLSAIPGAIAVAVAIGSAVQYSARGLGYLFLGQRERFAHSVRWRNLLRELGVHESWLTIDLPRPQIARRVGDALFVGICRLGIGYFLVAALLFLFLGLLTVGNPYKGDASPIEIALLLTASATLPAIGIFFWVGRRRTPA